MEVALSKIYSKNPVKLIAISFNETQTFSKAYKDIMLIPIMAIQLNFNLSVGVAAFGIDSYAFSHLLWVKLH